jgi:hypothetical protein
LKGTVERLVILSRLYETVVSTTIGLRDKAWIPAPISGLSPFFRGTAPNGINVHHERAKGVLFSTKVCCALSIFPVYASGNFERPLAHILELKHEPAPGGVAIKSGRFLPTSRLPTSAFPLYATRAYFDDADTHVMMLISIWWWGLRGTNVLCTHCVAGLDSRALSCHTLVDSTILALAQKKTCCHSYENVLKVNGTTTSILLRSRCMSEDNKHTGYAGLDTSFQIRKTKRQQNAANHMQVEERSFVFGLSSPSLMGLWDPFQISGFFLLWRAMFVDIFFSAETAARPLILLSAQRPVPM